MINNHCHIVYDLDDVLADFWGTALPIMNSKFGLNLVKESFNLKYVRKSSFESKYTNPTEGG